MRILNFTAHMEEREAKDTLYDEYELVFSIWCCGNLVVEEVVQLYDPSDDELEAWAANKLRSLFTLAGPRL